MHSKRSQFVLCPQLPKERSPSRVAAERSAKMYWDRLTLAQEGWALRKMGFSRLGAPQKQGLRLRT
jgi:hypothetical protein